MIDMDIHAGRERRNKLAQAVEFEWQKNDSTVMSFWIWYEIDPADPDVGISSPEIRVIEAECFKITNDDGPSEVLEIAWESDGSRGDIVVGGILGEYLPTESHADEYDEIAGACRDQQEAFAEQYDKEGE
jgi:hypothetical protein